MLSYIFLEPIRNLLRSLIFCQKRAQNSHLLSCLCKKATAFFHSYFSSIKQSLKKISNRFLDQNFGLAEDGFMFVN